MSKSSSVIEAKSSDHSKSKSSNSSTSQTFTPSQHLTKLLAQYNESINQSATLAISPIPLAKITSSSTNSSTNQSNPPLFLETKDAKIIIISLMLGARSTSLLKSLSNNQFTSRGTMLIDHLTVDCLVDCLGLVGYYWDDIVKQSANNQSNSSQSPSQPARAIDKKMIENAEKSKQMFIDYINKLPPRQSTSQSNNQVTLPLSIGIPPPKFTLERLLAPTDETSSESSDTSNDQSVDQSVNQSINQTLCDLASAAYWLEIDCLIDLTSRRLADTIQKSDDSSVGQPNQPKPQSNSSLTNQPVNQTIKSGKPSTTSPSLPSLEQAVMYFEAQDSKQTPGQSITQSINQSINQGLLNGFAAGFQGRERVKSKSRRNDHSIHQSISQSINQSISQAVSQSSNPSFGQQFMQLINQSSPEKSASIARALAQFTNGPANSSSNQLSSQFGNLSLSQSSSQSSNQSSSSSSAQPSKQSTSQSAAQPAVQSAAPSSAAPATQANNQSTSLPNNSPVSLPINQSASAAKKKAKKKKKKKKSEKDDDDDDDQSTNQLNDNSVNQSSTQSIQSTQSLSHSITQSVDDIIEGARLSFATVLRPLTDQEKQIDRAIDRTYNLELVARSEYRPLVNHTINQTINLSNNQSVNQTIIIPPLSESSLSAMQTPPIDPYQSIKQQLYQSLNPSLDHSISQPINPSTILFPKPEWFIVRLVFNVPVTSFGVFLLALAFPAACLIYTGKSINPSIDASISASISHASNQSVNQSSTSGGLPASNTMSSPVSQPNNVNQSIKQSIHQSINHSISRPSPLVHICFPDYDSMINQLIVSRELIDRLIIYPPTLIDRLIDRFRSGGLLIDCSDCGQSGHQSGQAECIINQRTRGIINQTINQSNHILANQKEDCVTYEQTINPSVNQAVAIKLLFRQSINWSVLPMLSTLIPTASVAAPGSYPWCIQSVSVHVNQSINQTNNQPSTETNGSSDNQTIQQVVSQSLSQSLYSSTHFVTLVFRSSALLKIFLDRDFQLIENLCFPFETIRRFDFDGMGAYLYDQSVNQSSTQKDSSSTTQPADQSINPISEYSVQTACNQCGEMGHDADDCLIAINGSINPGVNESMLPAMNILLIQKSMYQSVDPSIDQSIDHSIDQPYDQSVNQSLDAFVQSIPYVNTVPIDPSIYLSSSQSIAQITYQCIQSISQASNQSDKMINTLENIIASNNQLNNQSINQSINQVSTGKRKRRHESVGDYDDSVNSTNSQLISRTTNQSINQSTDTSINQSTNQSNGQSANPSEPPSRDELDSELIETIDRSLTGLQNYEQSINRSINQSINQPSRYDGNQSTDQSTTQLIYQSDALFPMSTINEFFCHCSVPGPIISITQSTNQSDESINQSNDGSPSAITRSNKQSINQSTNQSVNQYDLSWLIDGTEICSNCQLLIANQSINQSIHQLFIDPSFYQSINQSMIAQLPHPLGALINTAAFTINQSTHHLYDLHDDVNQSINQSLDPSIDGQSIYQSDGLRAIQLHQTNSLPQLYQSQNQSINPPVSQSADPTDSNYPVCSPMLTQHVPSGYADYQSQSTNQPIQSIESATHISVDFCDPHAIASTINQLVSRINYLESNEAKLLKLYQDSQVKIDQLSQSLNQSINQSINQSALLESRFARMEKFEAELSQLESTNQSITQSIKQTDDTIKQTVAQSINQSHKEVERTIKQSVNQSVSQFDKRLHEETKKRVEIEKWIEDQMINQSDQSTNQSEQKKQMNKKHDVLEKQLQSINQSINQSITSRKEEEDARYKKLLKQVTDLEKQSVKQSALPSITQSINQSVTQSISQSVNQTIQTSMTTQNQSVDARYTQLQSLIKQQQEVNQSISQSTNQSIERLIQKIDSVERLMVTNDSQMTRSKVIDMLGFDIGYD